MNKINLIMRVYLIIFSSIICIMGACAFISGEIIHNPGLSDGGLVLVGVSFIHAIINKILKLDIKKEEEKGETV